MLRNLICVVGLVAGVLALGACATGQQSDVKFVGTVKVTLETEKKSTEVSIRALNRIEVTLPAAPAGFGWQISFHDSRYLKQLSEVKPTILGGAGDLITFVAINRGKSRLRFLLAPLGNEREARPIDQQELVLTIQ